MPTKTPAQTARAHEVEETWPRLSYHYGLSISEIRSTPRLLLDIYVRQLGVILAHEQESRIEAASFAHMEPEDQRNVRDRLREARESARRDVEEGIEATGGVNPLLQVVGMGIDIQLEEGEG